MPRYVYGCDDKTHQRVEVVHSIAERPLVACPVCHQPMHRVPQKVDHYNNPRDTLDKMIAAGEFSREANERRADAGMKRIMSQ